MIVISKVTFVLIIVKHCLFYQVKVTITKSYVYIHCKFEKSHEIGIREEIHLIFLDSYNKLFKK